MASFAGHTKAELENIRKTAAKHLAIKQSKDEFLPFIRYTMPHPDHEDDATKSQYEITPQAQLLTEIMMRVEAFVMNRDRVRNKKFDAFLESLGWNPERPLNRVCVSIGPQMGKTEVISKRFPAWFIGRNPHKHTILGQYNSDIAMESGAEVRAIMKHPRYADVFPNHKMRKGSEAKDLLVTERGGKSAFVGVGGSGSGKPADLFVIDDPIKNDEEANSEAYRHKTYKWFTGVSFARLKSRSAIVIVHTRWNEDDLIGRICDPQHPDHDPKVAAKWLYINIPAVIDSPELADLLGLELEEQTDPDVIEMFGEDPCVALWENQKSIQLMAEAKRLDARVYGALYEGKPSPDDGVYFQKEDLIEYETHELPDNLMKYGASDHALSEKQEADESVVGCFGLDEEENIWILPDTLVKRVEPDRLVAEMILRMQMHNPLIWWAEDEAISKSIGPFLRKEMIASRVYTTIDPIAPTKDLRLRCRSFQGRTQLGKVRFPKYASWWPRMKLQMLKFPYGTHDDFVAFCALIGLGLLKEIPANRAKETERRVKTGTMAWMKQASAATQKLRKVSNSGW